MNTFPKNRRRQWAVIAIAVAACTVWLVRAVLDSDASASVDQSGGKGSVDANHSVGFADTAEGRTSVGKTVGVRTGKDDGDAKGASEKKKRNQRLLDVSPAAMSEISPVVVGTQSAAARQRARARGTRARVLNERVERHLAALKARRNDASG